MPGLFARLNKARDARFRKKNAADDLTDALPKKPRWDDAHARTSVEPEEIHELLRCCTEELKSRGLDHPFLLLPFRPTSDPSAVRTFVRHFFDHDEPMSSDALAQELRMTEPMVIAGVVKWCWSRLQGGVVGWDAYELFKIGEYDSNMARDSFKTFIPISVENGARQRIIFYFFDLLAAIAAHGKVNGFGGRKLSRMAAWWAFEQKDTGNGFEGGYKSWLSAADATSHLFFAYLRSLLPEQTPTGIDLLPRSLQKLLLETEYPPQTPTLLMSRTSKVVMIVETVSPTPFALLRRANHFQYRESDRELREFSEYEDPVQALTDECRRVLKSISGANQSQVSNSKHSTSLRDASWSRFEDIGFSSALEEEDEDDESALAGRKRPTQEIRSTPASGANGLARPTTPSWADFLSSGFVDENPSNSNMLLPPDKVLPPIGGPQLRQQSSQSHRPRLQSDQDLEPGELASITILDLDDAFWWVWMSSLAPEETPERKSAFGRCAVIETRIRTGRWLIMEEMIAGAAPDPQEGAYIAEKKGLFSWTKRARTIARRNTTSKKPTDKVDKLSAGNFGSSRTSIGPDTHARIQAKAAQLRAIQDQEEQNSQLPQRRGRTDSDLITEKTNSVFTLQPNIVGEASSAMKWVKKYDKGTIKDAYMANSSAGRGLAVSPAPSDHTNMPKSPNGTTNGRVGSPEVPAKDTPLTPAVSPLPKNPSAMSLSIERKPIAPPSPAEKVLAIDIQPVELEDSGLASPIPPPKDDEFLPASPTPAPAVASAPTPPAASTLGNEKAIASDLSELSLENRKQQKGFRKLFGSRRNRASKIPENAPTELNGMLGQHASRSESPLAQHPITAVAPMAVSPVSEAALSPVSSEEPQPADDINSGAETPKTAVAAEPTYEPSVGETISNVDVHDAAEAKREFASFDQGPLADQPAFAPDNDEEDDAIPSPIARAPVNDDISNDNVEKGLAQGTSPGIQDRWAQIRKNAAERAATRQPEEPTRVAPNKTTEGDDDTSGEETIESRVARIKARVAELTGNMEGTTGPAQAAAAVRT